LFGFLAQKGFEKENWPVDVKERVEKVKVPRMVTWP
jgi:seryl-tRNA synthetase